MHLRGFVSVVSKLRETGSFSFAQFVGSKQQFVVFWCIISRLVNKPAAHLNLMWKKTKNHPSSQKSAYLSVTVTLSLGLQKYPWHKLCSLERNAKYLISWTFSQHKSTESPKIIKIWWKQVAFLDIDNYIFILWSGATEWHKTKKNTLFCPLRIK